MFCIISFVILSILGIFSATNRALAREALDCVLRRVTLRPCNTGFDEKMKARILGTVITRSETAARLINRNFELLSWAFFILMLASSIWSVRGLYLFYTTGSCNGLNQSGFCVFDPTGANNEVSNVGGTCPAPEIAKMGVTLQDVRLEGFPVKNPQAKDKIVMIACYHCEYSRQTYPMIVDLVERYNTSFTFLHYPVKEKTDYYSRLGYCAYQQNPDAYWELNKLLFTTDKAILDAKTPFAPQASLGGEPAAGEEVEANLEFLIPAMNDLGFDAEAVVACASDPQTKSAVQAQMEEVIRTNFYGTPTVFINGTALVGPKPYRVYAILLKGLLYWLH